MTNFDEQLSQVKLGLPALPGARPRFRVTKDYDIFLRDQISLTQARQKGAPHSGTSMQTGKNKGRRALATLCAIGVLHVSGCSARDQTSKPSGDVKALQQLVDISADLKSARWEMFGTPEYDGGAPGPTDYMTLIAEIEPVTHPESFTRGTNSQSIYIVPEAARPWLSSKFRNVLKMNRNADIDLAKTSGCHAYDAKIKTSGRKASGFACENSGKILLYLSLY